MGQFLAITFDGADDAEAALKSIRSVEHASKIGLEDTAVVRKDADGKVTFHNEASSGTEAGVAVGAVLGGLLFVVFPVGAIVGGAVAGGLVGRAAAPGIDGKLRQGGRRGPAAGRLGPVPPGQGRRSGPPGRRARAVPRARPSDLVRRRHRAGPRRVDALRGLARGRFIQSVLSGLPVPGATPRRSIPPWRLRWPRARSSGIRPSRSGNPGPASSWDREGADRRSKTEGAAMTPRMATQSMALNSGHSVAMTAASAPSRARRAVSWTTDPGTARAARAAASGS